jgi:3-oxoacyl-[acyl-carrier protein] reductase
MEGIMIDPGLRGRCVLVTGANNPLGIGAATATACARLGARVFLHFHRSVDGCGSALYREQQSKSPDEVLQALESVGAAADVYEADFNSPDSVPDLFARAERAMGRVDVLVNNAAAWHPDTFVPFGDDTRNRYLELFSDPARPLLAAPTMALFAANVVAPALLIREFVQSHAGRGARWGRIINISTAGSDCFPSEVSYGASKYALESVTRSAAHELGQFGITINVLALGPVQTGWITPELEREILPTIPLGRVGRPDDVADVVVFLASEQARWITGQKIFVSGGHRM